MTLPPQVLSPLDGRYHGVVSPLGEYLSEAGLNRARVVVEVEWLIYLTAHSMCGTTPLSESDVLALRSLVTNFGQPEIDELARLEATTRHDVKAVEYLVRSKLSELGLDHIAELTHFACTSEDINNLSYALIVRDAIAEVWMPALEAVITRLRELAELYRSVPMLARTHGQPATPTTMGKELAVFVYRLERLRARIGATQYLGKFSGATGTFAAHAVAIPEANWPEISREFVTSLGLTWNPLTTQIESHDWQAELYSEVSHVNRVLHNLATDVWTYISLGYFRQIPQAGATGSSTMPHKINPIRFENAEANLELSCAVLDSLAATLVVSRLQRDLTDSTTQRNIGVGLGHSLLALDNIRRGLHEIDLDQDALAHDLDTNWEILGEAIQTVIRAEVAAGRSSISDPYALLKELTRGKRIGQDDLIAFVTTLEIGEQAKARLLALTLAGYAGLASELVDYLNYWAEPDSPCAGVLSSCRSRISALLGFMASTSMAVTTSETMNVSPVEMPVSTQSRVDISTITPANAASAPETRSSSTGLKRSRMLAWVMPCPRVLRCGG
jgi:adenylosuccinate lyase